MASITWKVETGNVTHSIPDQAIVKFEGENGELMVWVDKDGKVKFFDIRDSIVPPICLPFHEEDA